MKIIYILLDAISYKHSWLANGEAMPNLAAQKTITLTFIDILTGAWATSQITVNANITPQGSTVEGGGQG